MKRTLVHFILVIVIAIILGPFFPWWSVMLAGFLSGLFMPLKKAAVFFIPFLAIALLWMIQAFIISSANDFTLAKKIAVLFPLGGNPYLLILVTGIVGGLAAGVAGILGKQCHAVFISKT
ncbi:hypothetical protein [Gaetbulibacter aestuarii]|uniref:Uncharacterized protein n=1 Tax=Gaetbulibacter aestuarii TaxID=1502358 RepID=A0ABW7MUK5_9FLAO